jgi:alpha-glucoside transport system permease protein
MVERTILAIAAVLGVPGMLVANIVGIEALLSRLASRRREAFRPWLWLAPALALLLFFELLPALNTAVLSLLDARSERFVGLENFRFVFTDATMLSALRNNAIWLILFTGLVVGLGLLIAVLTGRVRYEAAAASLVLLPMAVSFVAAGVIWRFMYDFRPIGAPQTGTLNGLLTALVPGFAPQAWLIAQPWNNLGLIVA